MTIIFDGNSLVADSSYSKDKDLWLVEEIGTIEINGKQYHYGASLEKEKYDEIITLLKEGKLDLLEQLFSKSKKHMFLILYPFDTSEMSLYFAAGNNYISYDLRYNNLCLGWFEVEITVLKYCISKYRHNFHKEYFEFLDILSRDKKYSTLRPVPPFTKLRIK